MSYSLDPLQDDCYENSSILKNKFNLKDEEKLNAMEQSLTSMLIAQAYINIPFENVDFNFYKKLHNYVFSDIYEWAGTNWKVDMSKKGTKFCPKDKIEERGNKIFERLKNNEFLRDYHGEEFINEFTDLYCDLNYLHPFREGNGRIQRLFLSMLIESIGKHIDFSDIDSDSLMIATIKSVSGDVFMLRDIFREHIKK